VGATGLSVPAATLGVFATRFKHLFERVSTLSVAGGRTVQTFDRTPVRSLPASEADMSTLVLRPAAAPIRGAARTASRGGPAVRPRAVAAAARVARPARLRLTRRGRVVVRLAGVLLGAFATAAAVLSGGRVALAGEDARPVPVERLTVQPGETLWGIAGRVAPEADRRDTVARIVELNALPSAALQAGQRIAVPAAP
jgi:hypothetical protein